MRLVLKAFNLLVLFSVCAAGQAQIDRDEVNGTITDASGATLAGVTVTVTQEGTNAIRVVTTNRNGQFVASSLPVGHFDVTFTMAGFHDLTVPDIDLHAGDVRTLNEKMQLGSVSQSVSVVSAPEDAQLEKSNATFGGAIQSVQIHQLPLNGRNISTLELLAPGAIDNGTGQQSSIRFAGQGIDDNNYRFDGVDASGIFREALKSALRLQFSTEAVAEFKVDSGAYTADTGGSAGGQVSLISKSGTNQFHGSVFDYLRNSYFDAQGPFKPAVRQNFHLNQFGGNLGGPVVKDNTFFFVNYEGFRQSLSGIPQIGIVPSPAFRAQVIAAQPSLAPIVNAFPQGQTPSPEDPNAYTIVSVVPSPDTENSGDARIDYRFSDRDSSYIRYNIDNGTSTSALNALQQAITVSSRVDNFVLEESHIFSPTMLNEAEFGFNRNTYMQSQKTGEPYNFSVSGFTVVNENYSKEQAGQAWSFNDTLTATRGTHTIKAGVDLRFPEFREQNSVDGTATFLNEEAFLANQLNTFQTTAALPDKGLVKEDIAGYIQDEWKASKELTVNYGMRYQYFSPFHCCSLGEDPFDVASCGGYCGIGAQFSFNNYLNFEPRVGFAYSPDSMGGKAVFRGGFGIYHGEDQLGDEDSPVVNTEPSTLLTSGVQSNGSTVQYSYPVNPALTPSTGLALTPRSMARHHPDSYTEQWTGSMQYALTAQTVATFTYIGVKGTHLFRRSYTNLIDPLTNTRPLPQFPSEIDTKYNEGKSIFHALQVNLNRRFHGGFFVAGNYMFSKALDDASVGAGEADAAENINCFQCEWGQSDDNVTHTGNVSLVYDLPFGVGRKYMNTNHALDTVLGGWSYNTLFEARSGLPLNITLARKASALPDGNNVNQRPNRVPGVALYQSNRTVHGWLNPAAFAVPAAGTWGDLSKNAANGTPLWQDDSTLQKTFRVTEQSDVIFRAEAFNVFNRAQYGQPGTALNVGSGNALSVPANFGVVTAPVNTGGLIGTGTPRVLEFALRITY